MAAITADSLTITFFLTLMVLSSPLVHCVINSQMLRDAQNLDQAPYGRYIEEDIVIPNDSQEEENSHRYQSQAVSLKRLEYLFNKLENNIMRNEPLKRQWSKSMTMWGKRSPYFYSEDMEDPHALRLRRRSLEKTDDNNKTKEKTDFQLTNNVIRSWKSGGMKLWGKRPFDKEMEESRDADLKKLGENMDWKQKERDLKRSWSGNAMKLWGKRDNTFDDQHDKKSWSSKNMKLWGKREDDKRSWNSKSLKVWGKRDVDQADEENNKRSWSSKNMKLWGKRNEQKDGLEYEKRPWSSKSMKLWGKRDNSVEADINEKRQWNSNGMKVWGKRMDGEIIDELSNKRKWNSKEMKLWGKRDSIQHNALNEKRGWNAKGMKLWGKRSEKRPWNGKGMKLWGKRDSSGYESESNNYPYLYRKRSIDVDSKRSWKSGGIKLWGKRDMADGDVDLVSNLRPAGGVKRPWNSGMKLWGKKRASDSLRDFDSAKSDSWIQDGKRSWIGKNPWATKIGFDPSKRWRSMKLWGKRDSGQSQHDYEDALNKWNSMKLWGKDLTSLIKAEIGNNSNTKSLSNEFEEKVFDHGVDNETNTETGSSPLNKEISNEHVTTRTHTLSKRSGWMPREGLRNMWG
ncbi:protein RNA-directed DNA methylation 3 [Lingula anatina]|uniref:Protein RNA-directed DNA methylation 3 n=1 Tax=Lingula anatina TaxID=7574 RepID=A0A1S3HQZ2_LINAN|nr:protein RNA-directed DNA methylation 3 [Lingula anatina]XP_013388470.1 protein RNA-directed DNA methylation 3 [Lingula anatina]XP_013388471.1 protein RNA-directed DNA methylation 3 [Lingula anatina]XP_013388472.1 protein RNA-directed DNA methylation 3 [Lingula anatina]XP_013388473.1 protein RNA-directed DNA methylation 3 [Lingula anatina]|eukprot:XP_013388469.1 protein RNA-directed DNA methylation 3 [Lingula anatina]